VLHGCNQAGQVVANDALEDHLDTQLVELLSQVKRISVAAGGREQFGADRDDLGVHG
jgi:hypothetical protein